MCQINEHSFLVVWHMVVLVQALAHYPFPIWGNLEAILQLFNFQWWYFAEVSRWKALWGQVCGFTNRAYCHRLIKSNIPWKCPFCCSTVPLPSLRELAPILRFWKVRVRFICWFTQAKVHWCGANKLSTLIKSSRILDCFHCPLGCINYIW